MWSGQGWNTPAGKRTIACSCPGPFHWTSAFSHHAFLWYHLVCHPQTHPLPCVHWQWATWFSQDHNPDPQDCLYRSKWCSLPGFALSVFVFVALLGACFWLGSKERLGKNSGGAAISTSSFSPLLLASQHACMQIKSRLLQTLFLSQQISQLVLPAGTPPTRVCQCGPSLLHVSPRDMGIMPPFFPVLPSYVEILLAALVV